LVLLREVRAQLAQHRAAQCFAEHARAKAAIDEIRQRVITYERQAHGWQIPDTEAVFGASHMHSLLSCCEQAIRRMREAAAQIPRAELARQRAYSASREARLAWSRAKRRADAIAGQWSRVQREERRKHIDREEEQLSEERLLCARVALLDMERRR